MGDARRGYELGRLRGSRSRDCLSAGVIVWGTAAKGADSERMSRWSKRNVFHSKIAMGIVFAILGVLVLPKFGGFIADVFIK